MGLVARAVEEAGIPTFTMSVGLDITSQVRPPRAAFLDYPMGNECGRPRRVEEQRAILVAALRAMESMRIPGSIADLGMAMEGRAPDGRPWREWVYTKDFRRHHMRTREGERPSS